MSAHQHTSARDKRYAVNKNNVTGYAPVFFGNPIGNIVRVCLSSCWQFNKKHVGWVGGRGSFVISMFNVCLCYTRPLWFCFVKFCIYKYSKEQLICWVSKVIHSEICVLLLCEQANMQCKDSEQMWYILS